MIGASLGWISFELGDTEAASQVFGDFCLLRMLKANHAIHNGRGDVQRL